MYNNQFVACIKSNGKIIREFNETIYLKFGCEYSILMKNLSNRKAVAHIFIDGVDVGGGGFVIDPKAEIEIERFVKDLSQGNRFKFIEKTSSVEEYRGSKIEDGLIRIEFEYEREYPYYPPYDPTKVYYRDTGFFDKNAIVGGWSSYIDPSATISLQPQSTLKSPGCPVRMLDNSSFGVASAQVNDAGITVPGSISDQKFRQVTCYTDGIKHTMVFKVLGSADGKPVEKSVTVKAKPTCTTCGRVNKATAKFCNECGTSLTVI